MDEAKNRKVIKDYYQILKVDRKASHDAIKRSFRHLAHLYHPDKNPDNQFISGYFLEIQEAYQVLSSPLSRRVYDRKRAAVGEAAKAGPAITCAYLGEQVAKLNHQITRGNGLNINQVLLGSYLEYLLSEEHVAVLLREGSEQQMASLYSDVLAICQLLKPHRFLDLQPVLEKLTGNHPQRRRQLNELERRKKRQLLIERLVPFLVVLLTLLICLWMYWYAT